MAAILVGVTGGIAAYKAADVVSALGKRGHTCRVVMTKAAQHFIPEMTLAVISENAVTTSLWDELDGSVATDAATIIQTRHRIPETALKPGQVLVYQVPIPEPLRFLEPRETETRKMHALEEYGLMHVKLYEDIARHGHISTTYAYPVRVDGRYLMDPSPTPKFDNPKMDNCPALQLFGAGREKRIYAIPPYTSVVSLDFEDHPFEPTRFDMPCGLCGAKGAFLDEVVLDDDGGRLYACSDTDYCERRRAAGHRGEMLAETPAYLTARDGGRSNEPS